MSYSNIHYKMTKPLQNLAKIGLTAVLGMAGQIYAPEIEIRFSGNRK